MCTGAGRSNHLNEWASHNNKLIWEISQVPEIRIIGAEHKQDINIPNEPFLLFGRMIPSYMNGQWQYRVVHFGKDEVHEMCYQMKTTITMSFQKTAFLSVHTTEIHASV